MFYVVGSPKLSEDMGQFDKKKGWYRPSLCIPCKKDSESTDNLLTRCKFTLDIWKKICLILNIFQVWEGENFDHCVFHW